MNPLVAALYLPRILLRHSELLSAFVRRELRARIEGSILGRLWPIVQPMVLFAIYYLVFARVLKIPFSDDLAPHGPDGVGWRSTFYLVTGILPWTVLAECLTRGSGVVLENANLIKKIAFPSELLPLYSTIVFHVYFAIGFVILLALQIGVNGGLPLALLWLPVVLLVQFLFVNGLAMFFSAANIFVRDVSQAVPVLVTFWMFTTPVFYDLSAVREATEYKLFQAESAVTAVEAELLASPPAAADGARLEAAVVEARAALEDARDGTVFARVMTEAMAYNPMAVLLDLYRSIFSFGKVPFPVDRLLKLLGVALVVQWLSYAFFLRCKGRFADEV